MEYSEHQRLLLEAFCQHFHENGAWPTCGVLDKQLRRHADLDVEEVIKELDTFMHDGWRAPLSGWNPDQIIVMNVRAFHTCQADGVFPDVKDDLVAFMALVQLCIKRYEDGEEDVLVTAEEGYYQVPASSHQPVDNAFELVRVENLCGQSGSGAGSWSFKVSSIIRKYRSVKTLEEYLAVRRKLLTPKLVYTGPQSGVQPSNRLDRFVSEYAVVAGDGADLLGSSPQTLLPTADVAAPADAPQPDGPADAVVPMELVQGTRGYIEKVARQINKTYDDTCFDASAVMIRRLIETLIIEVFEANGIADRIKQPSGDFLMLRDLIDRTLAEPSLSLTRNLRAALPRLKTVGDRSAHDRLYNAMRRDIDNAKEDLRLVVQALLYLARLK